MREKMVQDEVARVLKKAGFEFQRDPSIAGLRPDFVVEGPAGQRVIVEVKAWDPVGGNTARALSQAEHYRRLTKADHAIVVLPELKRNFKERGVISTDALIETLNLYFETPHRRRAKLALSRPRSSGIVFAAMPFDREYDDTYFVAMSYAAEKVNAACKRVDRSEFSGDIVEEIKRLISISIAVVVDLSESKPNVLYEAGFSHALKKPTVHICSTSIGELPFDVRNWNTIPYRRGQTSALREPLAQQLAAVIRRR